VDSARQTGLDSFFQVVLIVVKSGDRAGNKNSRKLLKSTPTLMITHQPEAPQSNIVDRLIQREKLV
jgi:hypothetical protein